MDAKKLLRLVPKRYTTPIFVPKVEKVTSAEQDGDFDKFAGLPSVEKDFKYPMCGCCGKPMHFLFQLTIPEGMRKEGKGPVVQMFQCLNLDRKCGLHYTKLERLHYTDYKKALIANFPRG